MNNFRRPPYQTARSSAARRAARVWRVGKRAELAPAVEGNEKVGLSGPAGLEQSLEAKLRPVAGKSLELRVGGRLVHQHQLRAEAANARFSGKSQDACLIPRALPSHEWEPDPFIVRPPIRAAAPHREAIRQGPAKHQPAPSARRCARSLPPCAPANSRGRHRSAPSARPARIRPARTLSAARPDGRWCDSRAPATTHGSVPSPAGSAGASARRGRRPCGWWAGLRSIPANALASVIGSIRTRGPRWSPAAVRSKSLPPYSR